MQLRQEPAAATLLLATRRISSSSACIPAGALHIHRPLKVQRNGCLQQSCSWQSGVSKYRLQAATRASSSAAPPASSIAPSSDAAAAAAASHQQDIQGAKVASQAYIDKYVMPQARATLHVYKFQEDIFRQLLVTPQLDEHLRDDRALQWAAATVMAAVDDAIQIAYTTKSGNRSTGNSPVHGSPAHMAAAGSSNSSSSGTAAAAADQQAGSSPDTAGCTSNDNNEQCVMHWSSLDCADSHMHTVHDVQQLPVFTGGPGATASMSLDSARCADQAAAQAAVKLETALEEPFDVTAAHTFLQRVLYMINRLNHFWYDDLSNYVNERSAWMAALRERIEGPWQSWELQQLLAAEGQGRKAWQDMTLQEIKDGLTDRYHMDVAPPLSPAQRYITDDMTPNGYCHLLAVGALDGLVEASRQSRVCAGVANEVACTIFRVLMEEYGTGRYSRKHSTFYVKMMAELGLNTREEFYLDLVPWQCLACSNHNFLLTERRRSYLRYAGALSFFEINGPSVYKTYLAAGQRCGLSEDSTGYWALHIKEDERHGRQMLEEVALPLVDMYPDDCWELLWGYDQDRFMGARAGAALVAHITTATELQQQQDFKAV